MSVLIQGSQLRALLLGVRVSKDTGVVVNGDDALFTVATGRVLVTSLLGTVTVVIGATISNAKLTYDPTATGTSFDLCTAVAITSDAVKQTYYIAGNVGTPGALLVAGTVGQSNPVLAQPLCLEPGSILQTLSADPVGGEINWTLTYIPLDDGATVTAAA